MRSPEGGRQREVGANALAAIGCAAFLMAWLAVTVLAAICGSIIPVYIASRRGGFLPIHVIFKMNGVSG